jgi:hypothetical protein
MTRVLCASALVVVLLAGCSAKQPAEPAPDRTPEQVARSYYELLAAGREEDARSLMWRPDRFSEVVADRSLRGLTELEVDRSREDTAAGRPPEYLELATLRMLVVRYKRHRVSSIGEPAGQDMRFVLVGQEVPGGPWLVVETGTGP